MSGATWAEGPVWLPDDGSVSGATSRTTGCSAGRRPVTRVSSRRAPGSRTGTRSTWTGGSSPASRGSGGSAGGPRPAPGRRRRQHRRPAAQLPNDVVVKSDGSIWFSDPPYGIVSDWEGHRAVSDSTATSSSASTPRPGRSRSRPPWSRSPTASPSRRTSPCCTSRTRRPSSERREREPSHRRLRRRRRPHPGKPAHLRGRHARCPRRARSRRAGNVFTSAGDGVHVLAPDGRASGRSRSPSASGTAPSAASAATGCSSRRRRRCMRSTWPRAAPGSRVAEGAWPGPARRPAGGEAMIRHLVQAPPGVYDATYFITARYELARLDRRWRRPAHAVGRMADPSPRTSSSRPPSCWRRSTRATSGRPMPGVSCARSLRGRDVPVACHPRDGADRDDGASPDDRSPPPQACRLRRAPHAGQRRTTAVPLPVQRLDRVRRRGRRRQRDDTLRPGRPRRAGHCSGGAPDGRPRDRSRPYPCLGDHRPTARRRRAQGVARRRGRWGAGRGRWCRDDRARLAAPRVGGPRARLVPAGNARVRGDSDPGRPPCRSRRAPARCLRWTSERRRPRRRQGHRRRDHRRRRGSCRSARRGRARRVDPAPDECAEPGRGVLARVATDG